MQDRIVYLQLTSNLCDTAVFINGMEVAKAQASMTANANVPIMEHLMTGTNNLELRVGPADQSDFPVEQSAEVKARIAAFADGDWLDMDAGNEIAVLSPTLSPPTSSPVTLNMQFTTDFGRDWAWTQAPRFSPDAVRPQLDDFVLRIASLFENRQFDVLLRLFEPVLRELVDAYPLMAFEFRAQDFLNMLNGPSLWQPIPVSVPDVIYQPIADGRMVEVMDKEGRPVIRTISTSVGDPWQDSNYVEISLRLGFWNRQITILH